MIDPWPIPKGVDVVVSPHLYELLVWSALILCVKTQDFTQKGWPKVIIGFLSLGWDPKSSQHISYGGPNTCPQGSLDTFLF